MLLLALACRKVFRCLDVMFWRNVCSQSGWRAVQQAFPRGDGGGNFEKMEIGMRAY